MLVRVLSATALVAAMISPAPAASPAILVNSTYSLQMPVEGEADARVSDQERSLKRSLYERAARECEDLKTTIALTCQVSSINVSTQVTRNSGVPSQIYVSANIQMQVTLK